MPADCAPPSPSPHCVLPPPHQHDTARDSERMCVRPSSSTLGRVRACWRTTLIAVLQRTMVVWFNTDDSVSDRSMRASTMGAILLTGRRRGDARGRSLQRRCAPRFERTQQPLHTRRQQHGQLGRLHRLHLDLHPPSLDTLCQSDWCFSIHPVRVCMDTSHSLQSPFKPCVLAHRYQMPGFRFSGKEHYTHLYRK